MERKATVTLEEISAWRKTRHDANLPSSFDDYYTVTGICRRCNGSGEVVDGRMKTDLSFEITARQKCHSCDGSGIGS